jgi:alpha-ketoglutarate-dependent taurine dioxygenase
MAATVQPIGGALGTDIEGVDLARKLWDEAFFAIKKAWSDHLILSFARDSSARPPPEQETVSFSKRHKPRHLFLVDTRQVGLV